MRLRVSVWNLLRASVMSVIILVAFLLQNNVHAQTVADLCDRTPQVRSAIIALIPGVEDTCDNDPPVSVIVTVIQLGDITGTLNLRNQNITDLQSSDFEFLTGLTRLDLSDNQLTALPPEIFRTLTSLTAVDVSGNPQNDSPPFTLTVTPVVDVEPNAAGLGGMAVIEVVQGVPFAVTATLEITNGEISASATIETGQTGSTPFPFRLTEELSGVITATITSSIPSGYSGFVLEAGSPLGIGGVCSRTPQVRRAIVAVINDPDQSPTPPDTPVTCNTVTNAQLAGITELDLSDPTPADGAGETDDDIIDLLPEDFAGLSGLTTLDLSDNQLRELPQGIFSGLTSLTGVDVSGNPGDPFTLAVTPVRTASPGMAMIEVVEGVPFAVTATVSLNGGLFSDNTATMDVTISAGATRSDPFDFTHTTDITIITVSSPMALDDSSSEITDIADDFDGSTGYSGFALAPGPDLFVVNPEEATIQPLTIGNVCQRSREIRREIFEQALSPADETALLGTDERTCDTYTAEDRAVVIPRANIARITSIRFNPRTFPSEEVIAALLEGGRFPVCPRVLRPMTSPVSSLWRF